MFDRDCGGIRLFRLQKVNGELESRGGMGRDEVGLGGICGGNELLLT